jgi:hypothetical protein
MSNNNNITQQFRCEKCGFFTLIEINVNNNNNEINFNYICPNQHSNKNISLNLISKINSNLMCENCKKIREKNEFFLCEKCKNFYCEECKLKHFHNKNLINLRIIDSKCLNHNLNDFKYFCKKNKLILCEFGDWGLGIGDWGLGIGDWAQSPIPNPQSPIPN